MNKKIINYFFVVGIFSLLFIFLIDTIHAEDSESQANVSFYGEYVFPEEEMQENSSNLNNREASIPVVQKYLPKTGVRKEYVNNFATVCLILAFLIQIKNVRYFKGRDFSYEV